MAFKFPKNTAYYVTRTINGIVTTVGSGYIALGVHVRNTDGDAQLSKNAMLFGALLIITQLPAYFFIKKNNSASEKNDRSDNLESRL